ncbi:hypothetical protein FACUT_738 [Fusarium acutatum]|uniref:Uncharacterized protein n=1 Tax=Fusarium acutatum TaxID=78861 RepID=A0A8H4K6B5_9HYPO|nr:hypothetical protein FACUT_738 [Fusarium acutatum]
MRKPTRRPLLKDSLDQLHLRSHVLTQSPTLEQLSITAWSSVFLKGSSAVEKSLRLQPSLDNRGHYFGMTWGKNAAQDTNKECKDILYSFIEIAGGPHS